ncbi:hypothetical protein PVAND_001566 [Polypedilum vanderplanki]|uniref:Fatty acid desaturase domain-containing protein n=1 Tax=Polypedilum vanderplanki TaxID=319348 RepID=A0A9J6BNT7_POLVA|nr:hypothetical protein PVAND_001566 [Polypedilum vanderplanki]
MRVLKWEIDLLNVFRFNYFLYGIFVGFPIKQPYGLYLFLIFWIVLSGYGITAGAHRLWSHRSYEAKLPLKIFLAFCNTIAFQRSIYKWCKIHRSHHQFVDTNADPHNSRRGLFFSHFGWMLIKPHQDVEKFGQKINLRDLENDKIVMFQHKNYPILILFCAFLLPISILKSWNISFHHALNMVLICHFIISNLIWLVNSYAHKFGSKPYNKKISATDSSYFAIIVLGEGFHNFHHVFPYDYRTSEYNLYWCNSTTLFIDLMTRIGWASNLKTVSTNTIRKSYLQIKGENHH